MEKLMDLLIILSVLLLSCTPEPIEPVEPVVEPTDDTTYVWKLPIFADTSMAYSSVFVRKIGSDKLIAGFAKLTYRDTGIIAMFDVANDLNKLWEWQDYYPDENQEMNSWLCNESYAYVNAFKAQYAIDLQTGTTLWQHKLPWDAGHSISLFENRIFHVRSPGVGSTIYMADITTGDWEHVFTVTGENGFESELYAPMCDINAKGDTILYFQDRQYRTSPSTVRTDFYAYNLSKKEVLWKLENISDETSNTSDPALDEQNRRIYFSTWHTLFCWDMDTGEEVWKISLSAGVLASTYLLYEGKLILKSDQGYLVGFDAETGEELYYVKQGGCCVGSKIAYDGRVYYTDRHIWIANAETGKVEEKILGNFSSKPPIIDEAKGLMYVMDAWYMYCMKIPTF